MIFRKAQAWGFDVMIAGVLFVMGLTLLYFYSINASSEGDDVLQLMSYDGEFASNILLSEGYPSPWNASTVVSPGLLTRNQIDESKLQAFSELASSNYEKSRALLHTVYHYYFNFSEPIVVGSGTVGYIGRQSTNPKNLVVTTRYIVYRNKTATMRLYLWQ